MKKITITPEQAREWLIERVHEGAMINLTRAGRFADDMSTGRWLDGGAPIVFDKAGKILDGMHRLAAVMLAGVPVEFHVAEDIDT